MLSHCKLTLVFLCIIDFSWLDILFSEQQLEANLTVAHGCLDIRVDTTGPLPFLLLLSEENVFILSNNKLFYLWNKILWLMGGYSELEFRLLLIFYLLSS